MIVNMAEEVPAPFFYANVMKAHLGAFDFTLDFGYKPPEELGTARYESLCRVGMSLSHAKSMLPILAKLISEYEKAFGTIPAPGFEEQARE